MSTATPASDTLEGFFAIHDFIRPGEEPAYADLDSTLRLDLAPAGILEHHLVDEIRRAMWRLRRCGKVEEGLLSSDPTLDPMQIDAAAKIQLAVDRARTQAHRIFHKCTAELRKLQTERQYRNETHNAGDDISHLGLCDLEKVRDGISADVAATARNEKNFAEAEVAHFQRSLIPPPVGSSCKNTGQQPGPMPKAA